MKPTLREAANAWMDKNPAVMDHFRRFAEHMRERNRKFGMKLIAERVRWEMHLRGDSEDTFKIGNNYVAYIARRLVQEDPRLAELIRCRVTKAADKPMRTPVASQEVDPLTEKPIYA